MNRSLFNSARRGAALAFCLFLAAPFVAGAQPPDLLHYQGRLLDAAGAPVGSPTVVYFSLWAGGDAPTANSGTEKLREHATVSPNAEGYFDHEIGAGTLDTGALNASLFATSSPVFIQIAVGSPGAVLTPRARIDTVGYAYIANRLGNKDGIVGPAGNPQVTAVTDVTGGVVVVGDLLRITGSALGTATVLIGGKVALVKTRSATQIDCLVPQGLTMGLQEVALTAASTGGSSVVVAHVDVHRMIVGVSTAGTGADNLFILDANTHTLKTSIPNGTYAIANTSMPIQIGFANQGSLALVPDDNAGFVYAVDLTANPPVVVDSIDIGAARAVAAAASPDGAVMIGCGISSGMVRAVAITESAPPYTSSALATTSTGLTMPSGFTQPRACAFFGDGLLIVAGDTNAVGYKRSGPTTFIGTLGTGTTFELTPVNAPFSIIPSRDMSRLLMLTSDSTNFRSYLVEPGGVSLDVTPATAVAGPNAVQAASNASDDTVVVAESSTDRIYIFQANGVALLRPGWLDGPTSAARNVQLAAMDPVTGEVVAVGTNDGTVLMYQRTGPALNPLTEIDLGTRGRGTFALAFQP